MINLQKYGELRIPDVLDSTIQEYRNYAQFLPEFVSDISVLEIWPGNWIFSIFLKNHYKLSSKNFTLLDASDSTVALLKNQASTREFNIELTDSIDYLEKRKQKYSIIVLRHVLEHMTKDYISNLVPLLEDVLADNWIIIVEVPNAGNIPYWLYSAIGDFSHMTLFTYESLVEAFQWHTKTGISVKTFNIFRPINFGKTIFDVCKQLIAEFFVLLSVIVTFVFMRMAWDRTKTGQVFTPFILAIINKDNHG